MLTLNMSYICPEPLDVCPCKTHRVKRCTKTGAKCKKKPSDSAPKKNNDADKPAKHHKRAKATCDHLIELYSQLEILDKERIRMLRQILEVEKTLPYMPKANTARKKADDAEKKANKKARKAKMVESESESSDSDSDSSDDD